MCSSPYYKSFRATNWFAQRVFTGCHALDDRTTDSIQAADLVGNSAHRYATEWSDDPTRPALDR